MDLAMGVRNSHTSVGSALFATRLHVSSVSWAEKGSVITQYARRSSPIESYAKERPSFHSIEEAG
jgi:hypothetical protein